MSKKETEFDRFDRMKKIERENDVTKKKNIEIFEAQAAPKKGGKLKSYIFPERKNWSKEYSMELEEEYSYN